MSLNNHIIIIKDKQYKVFDCCADEVSKGRSIIKRFGCSLKGRYDTLEKAFLEANKIDREYGVSYYGEIKRKENRSK